MFRKSGTGSSGMTIRLYLEKYDKENVLMETPEALKDIIEKALSVCLISQLTGMKEPTVIT